MTYEKFEDAVVVEARTRRAAVLSVLVSTATVFVAVVALPLFYAYALQLHSTVIFEAEFCRAKTRDAWAQLLASGGGTRQRRAAGPTEDGKIWHFGRLIPGRKPRTVQTLSIPLPSPSRSRRARIFRATPARSGSIIQPETAVIYDEAFYGGGGGRAYDDYGQAGYGSPQPPIYGIEVPEPSGSCCTCQQGGVGLPGEVGEPGSDGADGAAGVPGSDGLSPPPIPPPKVCERPCRPGLEGPAGLPGPKGAPGEGAETGLDGPDGLEGLAGVGGPPGDPGVRGPPSEESGPPGPPGTMLDGVTQEGPPGPAGPAGEPGPPGEAGTLGSGSSPGLPGEPGDEGDAGEDGTAGQPGLPGDSGLDGPTGSCDHCPPPRVPPGYGRKAA